jgi:hypothetical protein
MLLIDVDAIRIVERVRCSFFSIHVLNRNRNSRS